MPVLSSKYQAPWVFKNPHLHTIFPVFFRRVPKVQYQRQRLSLPDGDFIDLDWSLPLPHKNNLNQTAQSTEQASGPDLSRTLAVLLHGLEGSSKQQYIVGMAGLLNRHDMPIVAFNFRSCSGELNKLSRFYHSGDTEDLRYFLQSLQSDQRFDRIVLIGHSLGANVILKFLGEEGDKIKNWTCPIVSTVTFSCPVDLDAVSLKLAQPENKIYMANFLYSMKGKLKQKEKNGLVKKSDVDWNVAFKANNFLVWDNAVTAPLHGFKNSQDYYQKASALSFIEKIQIPTLLVNGQDDPFLAPSSFPHQVAINHPNFYLETPEQGGHVGFVNSNKDPYYWSEWRAIEFLQEILKTKY